MIILTGASGFLGQHVSKRLPEAVADDRIMCAEPGDTVIHLAAVCGGIGYNKDRNVSMMVDNLAIGLDAYERHKLAEKHIYISTTCMYPQICQVPFVERDIWMGRPEATNAPYGIAKRAISELFLLLGGMALVPANLYGPGDHYEPERSHVIPALIRRFVEARDTGAPAVECWGSGNATRDFLYVEDCASAIVRALHHYQAGGVVNVGTGVETTIHQLAHLIADAVGYTGEVYFSTPDQDGQPRRVLSPRMARHIGWWPQTSLEEGIKRTVEDYLCRPR